MFRKNTSSERTQVATSDQKEHKSKNVMDRPQKAPFLRKIENRNLEEWTSVQREHKLQLLSEMVISDCDRYERQRESRPHADFRHRGGSRLLIRRKRMLREMCSRFPHLPGEHTGQRCPSPSISACASDIPRCGTHSICRSRIAPCTGDAL